MLMLYTQLLLNACRSHHLILHNACRFYPMHIHQPTAIPALIRQSSYLTVSTINALPDVEVITTTTGPVMTIKNDPFPLTTEDPAHPQGGDPGPPAKGLTLQVVGDPVLLRGTAKTHVASPRANRIFNPAQAESIISLAPFAWDDTSTKCAIAMPRPHGTVHIRSPPSESTAISYSAATTPASVSTGNELKVAFPRSTKTAIDVLGAATPPMAPSVALEHRKHRALTPYKADAWESLLREAGLFHKYSQVPDGLRYGFFLNLPPINTTQTPPNRESIITYFEPVQAIINDEISKGRYIGPFTQSDLKQAIGPFQTSPLSVIPKTTPGRFRILQNYSFPYNTSLHFPNPSINSFINSDDFPTTWGTFSLSWWTLVVWRLPFCGWNIGGVQRRLCIPLHRPFPTIPKAP